MPKAVNNYFIFIERAEASTKKKQKTLNITLDNRLMRVMLERLLCSKQLCIHDLSVEYPCRAR